jgi:arabinose-5-phosphate isomerase
MGDALAVVLINSRRFSQKDFQRFHPGGNLGERLGVRIREVMLTDDRVPLVPADALIRDAVREMDAKQIGATLVADEQNRLAGLITDGDLRRALIKEGDILDMRAHDIMSSSPKTIEEGQTAAEALGLMELYGITHLVILDRERHVKGIVHLHDLLGREEFRLNGVYEPTARSDRRSDHTSQG